ncbi:hypothetical protein [Natrinema sp. H-ect4]|uniref:hypothetical protein n=1 Tax=Natrinema sp. H-ect4 TaxID=3242699 RepID=UPI0035A8DB45
MRKLLGYLFRLLLGTAVSFLTVNTVIGTLYGFLFPGFFHVGLLFRPDVLIFTIPLSVVFYLAVKLLDPVFEDSGNPIRKEFEEVMPDFGH